MSSPHLPVDRLDRCRDRVGPSRVRWTTSQLHDPTLQRLLTRLLEGESVQGKRRYAGQAIAPQRPSAQVLIHRYWTYDFFTRTHSDRSGVRFRHPPASPTPSQPTTRTRAYPLSRHASNRTSQCPCPYTLITPWNPFDAPHPASTAINHRRLLLVTRHHSAYPHCGFLGHRPHTRRTLARRALSRESY